MIEIKPLAALSLSDLNSVISGYVSSGRYDVAVMDEKDHIRFDLQYIALQEPCIKKFDACNPMTLQQYNDVLIHSCSFGAYEEDLLVGMILAEPHDWNRSLWVWEFHLMEAHRGKGIGRRLMDCAAEKARRAGLRTIVCETQNTNAPAIQVYRRLGFQVEGIDISYYTNQDYPHGEVAVFMKHRLEP